MATNYSPHNFNNASTDPGRRSLERTSPDLPKGLPQPANQQSEFEKQGAEEKEEDISVQVQKQAEAAKTEKKKCQVRVGKSSGSSQNICLITTILEDPTKLGLKILRDAAETKKQKNQCRSTSWTAPASSRYFLKEPKTFAIVFNRRFNNGLERESTINALDEIISAKIRGNKTQPEASGAGGDRRSNQRANEGRNEDAKSQESTESAEQNGKESGKKVAAEKGKAKDGEKRDTAKYEDGSQKEPEPAASAEDEAAPKEKDSNSEQYVLV
ncbi:conserved hypothetical protein [Culex quinquefasciatus]|uniref:Uncharacterized protein n=1 Tax=Culex quinquefasciatus TaxID=7176 RepID=B0X0C0_CULQU|nr:conserved hypothetical protein [Culex quinquefasciatus]|eukprot:XP_001863092.1 conserved hypothetical protein [Culex quinquefasciatus]